MKHLSRLLILLTLPLLSVTSAFASRAEVDGRGLPRLLAVDPSHIRTLPGSAGLFDAMGLVDNRGDAFILALGGKTSRYGYFVDNETHSIVLANPAGWGITLGYREWTNERKQFDVLGTDSVSAEYTYLSKNSTHELRLGLGWQHISASGRLFELGAGVTYMDTETTTRALRVVNDVEEVTVDAGWQSDPGIGFDVTVRSLTPSEGIQLAASFLYSDQNPKFSVPASVEPDLKQYLASLDIGWRILTPELDDLVLGFTSSWRKFDNADVQAISSNYVRIRESEQEAAVLGLFLSGERRVVEELRIRGGVNATVSFTESENTDTRDEPTEVRTREDSSTRFNSPVVFLGAGYQWKKLQADVQLRDSINLDTPFIRWSVTMGF